MRACGATTHVADDGSGPPLVLLHGYGDSADVWRRVAPALGERRILGIDLPPFGRSESPRVVDLMPFYLELLPALLADLGVERAALVGHSLGGAVALRLAAARPDLVSGLAVVAPAGLATSVPLWWRAVSATAPLWRLLEALPPGVSRRVVAFGVGRFADRRLAAVSRRTRAHLRHMADLHSDPRRLVALLDSGRACIGPYPGSLLAETRSIACPLLLVAGSGDPLVGAGDVAAFAAAHPHARVEVLDRCGHYPQLERSARVAELLSGWLALVDEAATGRDDAATGRDDAATDREDAATGRGDRERRTYSR